MVYCSSIERISFNEWDDRKGFVLVTIDTEDNEKKTTYEFVEQNMRPNDVLKSRYSCYPNSEFRYSSMHSAPVYIIH